MTLKKMQAFFEKFQFFEKSFSANLPGSRKPSTKPLFYKEKQQSMGVGIMRCEQEEKCPESSQKPKIPKRNMKI